MDHGIADAQEKHGTENDHDDCRTQACERGPDEWRSHLGQVDLGDNSQLELLHGFVRRQDDLSTVIQPNKSSAFSCQGTPHRFGQTRI